MKPSRKKDPVLTLTYRGLDLCDGCGVPLKPREQIGGLCPACWTGTDVREEGSSGRCDLPM
jgi:hypothetical protein